VAKITDEIAENERRGSSKGDESPYRGILRELPRGVDTGAQPTLDSEHTGNVQRLAAERPRQSELASSHSILEYPRL